VAVTGAGIISALGVGWAANAEGFRTGRTAFRPVTLFDVARQRVRVAAEVDLPVPPATRLSPKQVARLDRADHLLLSAAAEAMQQSGWPADDVTPVCVGTTGGGMNSGEAFYRQALTAPYDSRRQVSRGIQYLAHRQASHVAEAFGLGGPTWVISNACAAGANAIGHAWELIRTGRCDRVLAGGYDALCQMIFAGFDSLQALSPTYCRPFSADRDGLALGEGAGVLCLERLDLAQRRGALILGEIAGYGASTDIHHLTQPHPQGSAAVRTMSAACQIAGLGPKQIDYVNAHGTGTPLNDAAEAAAINQWAGARAATLPVSSTKAGVGHLLGAAGAVEAVVCLMALQGQWLPPTATTATPDPACAFPLVTRPTEAQVNCVMSNSFGFGGANASLVFRKIS
jgi:3-oxoacyl-[acyl-carrier-protein] synthase II